MEEAKKSSVYRTLVQTIQELIRAEGLDVAERAVSEALADPRREVFRHRLKAVSCPAGRWRGAAGDHGPRSPAGDHERAWVAGRRCVALTSEPYQLNLATLRQIVGFCDANELDVVVSADSWYFAGRTLLVHCSRREVR